MATSVAMLLKHAVEKNQISLDKDRLVITEQASASVRKLLKVPLGGNATVNLAELAGSKPRFLMRLFAENAIQKKYQALGGYRSALGLATDAKLKQDGDQYYMDYRGGRISVQSDGSGLTAQQRYRCEIWFVGIQCSEKQERTDEVCGAIGVIVGSTGSSTAAKFPSDVPYWSIGNNGQTVAHALKLYDGPPADVVLNCAFTEVDSGDAEVNRYKTLLAEKLVQGGKAALGQSIGSAGEAIVSDEGYLKDILKEVIGFVVDLFGANDDPYTSQQFRLTWDEIQGQAFTKKTRSGIGNYTHEITITGEDDGGDHGTYRLLFDVRVSVETKLM
jgi:hypothetical protein